MQCTDSNYSNKEIEKTTSGKKKNMAPLLSLLFIVVNLTVIRISNAQFDCSNESKLDEQSKIFCIFDVATFVDATEQPPAQSSGNTTQKSSNNVSVTTATTSKPTTTTEPSQTRSGCGLRNVDGLHAASAASSIVTSV